jgi:cyclic-di-GMP-binding protein
MALNLRVPSERVAPPKDLELRPRQAKAWVESLPLSQSADVGRKLLANLCAINRGKVDFDNRLQLLETYLPVAHVVFDELDAVYGKSLLPLPPKAREALALARELATEFAYGYKILILEKTGKLLAFGAKKQMPLLVHRAMQSLVTLLRASYRSYTPIPAGAWQEIHTLFLHAEKEGLAAEPADPETKATIADLYSETLFIALTDPYRLIPGDLDRITQVIRGQRGAYTLGQARPTTRPGGHFLVPCDQDKPPKPLLSANDDPGGPNWRLLDANPFVDRLRARRQAVESGNVSATTSKSMSPEMLALFAKLATLWGDPPKRTSRRDPMDTSVAICAGMRALTHFVAIEPKVDAKAEAAAIESGNTIPLVFVPDDEVSKSMNVNEWDVVNQSAGGLKVRRAGAATQAITVGEVLGIKVVGRAHWTVGVVRWLTMVDEGGMEFGIQFLAPAAKCVAVQPTISTAGQGRLGLILSEEEGFDGADMLLTPPATYSDLREFEIEEEGFVTRVRATTLIERTGRFELFHIAPS